MRHSEILLDAVEGRLDTCSEMRIQGKPERKQLRGHCSDHHGLPRAPSAFSLEDTGCIPSRGLIATEAPSRFQIL